MALFAREFWCHPYLFSRSWVVFFWKGDLPWVVWWIGMLIVAASLLTQKLAGLNRCPPQQITPQVLLQPYEVFIRCLLRKYHRTLRLAAWFRIWRRSTCWSRPPAWIWDLVLDAQVSECSPISHLEPWSWCLSFGVGSGLPRTWFDPTW